MSATKGLIWRQKWQAKLCLFGSPLFDYKVSFCKVFHPLFSFSYMKRTLLLLLYGLQVNFSLVSIDRDGLYSPGFCKGNILSVGILIFAETSRTEGLIGWGQLFVQDIVSVAVTMMAAPTISCFSWLPVHQQAWKWRVWAASSSSGEVRTGIQQESEWPHFITPRVHFPVRATSGRGLESEIYGEGAFKVGHFSTAFSDLYETRWGRG